MELSALIAFLFWLGLTLDRARRWPGELVLPTREPKHEAAGSGAVTAIVPARNEAEMLPRTLPSLLAQESVVRVLVVDDRSADGTRAAALGVAADSGDDRVRVIPVRETASGWSGKVGAMATGVDLVASDPVAAASEWLLFTDADIHHRDRAVEALLARADDGYDLVSIMARLRAVSLWERLLIPTFVFFFQLLYPFRRVSRSTRDAAAAGGCMLIRRTALERAGGLATIRSEIIDDVALARAIASAGGRVWLGLDPGIRSLRPYPHLADVWKMVARSAYDQLGYRPYLVLAFLIGLAALFVAPGALAPLALWKSIDDPGARLTALLGLSTIALQVLALYPSVRHHRAPVPFALVLPLSSLLFGAMTLSSAWSHHRGREIGWRDRSAAGADDRSSPDDD